jgi:hypothetical protein
MPAASRRAWGKVPYEERFRRQRRDLLDAAAAGGQRAFDTVRSVIRALVSYRGADPRLIAAIRAEARPGSALAAAYDEQHRQVADLLVVVALRLGSALPEPTIRLAALLLVNGVVDLAPELRERRDALSELATIVCLAFGLPVA